jgi:hypothetical protein|tara:strand:+ start:1974 stop:2189 length:216 start_codon:yes stop_codon:yes gene_type:complete
LIKTQPAKGKQTIDYIIRVLIAKRANRTNQSAKEAKETYSLISTTFLNPMTEQDAHEIMIDVSKIIKTSGY